MVAGKNLFSIIKQSVHDWSEDDAFSDSASIAYYSILSLPGFLVLILFFAGLFFGEQLVQGKISDQIAQIAGPQAANFIKGIITSSSQSGKSNISLIVGFATLALSATAVFLQLQKVLNKIWKVKPESGMKAGIMMLVFHRLSSLGLILFIGLLLLAAIVIAGTMSFLQNYIASILSGATIYIFYGISILVGFLLLSLLFAMIYKFLPDARITWKSAWAGAFLTASLFIIGIAGLQVYFTLSNPASSFGVASSAILILLWAYYSSMIFLLGAEFTKVYANSRSRGIIPSSYATRVTEC